MDSVTQIKEVNLNVYLNNIGKSSTFSFFLNICFGGFQNNQLTYETSARDRGTRFWMWKNSYFGSQEKWKNLNQILERNPSWARNVR